jgi:hypothetical protein
MTYEQALSRHPGAYIELQYRKIDAGYPGFQQAPVATAPAIFVWLDRPAAESGDESEAVGIYWLQEWD